MPQTATTIADCATFPEGLVRRRINFYDHTSDVGAKAKLRPKSSWRTRPVGCAAGPAPSYSKGLAPRDRMTAQFI